MKSAPSQLKWFLKSECGEDQPLAAVESVKHARKVRAYNVLCAGRNYTSLFIFDHFKYKIMFITGST